MPNYETLLADASHLSVTDRIQLIEALWDTVPADSLPPLSDEWLAEIQRRSAEVRFRLGPNGALGANTSVTHCAA